jgi:hypothetical protein
MLIGDLGDPFHCFLGVEFIFSPELSCSLTTAALHLCTLLLELTPFSAWPCSAFNEALITSQITRETVNVLVRSQNGMEGDWNIVNTFVENYENDFWEVNKKKFLLNRHIVNGRFYRQYCLVLQCIIQEILLKCLKIL